MRLRDCAVFQEDKYPGSEKTLFCTANGSFDRGFLMRIQSADACAHFLRTHFELRFAP